VVATCDAHNLTSGRGVARELCLSSHMLVADHSDIVSTIVCKEAWCLDTLFNLLSVSDSSHIYNELGIIEPFIM